MVIFNKFISHFVTLRCLDEFMLCTDIQAFLYLLRGASIQALLSTYLEDDIQALLYLLL